MFLSEWQNITTDKWILSVLAEGLKLEFVKPPPNTGVIQTCVNAKHLDILVEETEKLLKKHAVEFVPLQEIDQGFYATLFLVPQKTGELRPVINLKPLNREIIKILDWR